ncbi:MAG: 3-isopropylmalate dehydratase large subunit [Candidatus Omnitrophota bacterium]|nr:MAG: 3-isopropylmalate dehydratase large subunit [Candidatus Omnitrophota bacterium]
MGYTIAEKILSQHSRKKVKAGDTALCDIDFCFGQDGTSELVIDSFLGLGKKRVFDKEKFCIVIDHSTPSPREAISNIHQKLRKFTQKQGTLLFDVGCGVCHQVIPQAGLILPGNLVVGADSHTCTYGALNAFACGLGSTDVAVALASGKNWFRVPETIKLIVKGKLPKGVTAKDIILYIIGQLGANGCTYMAVEFTGCVIDKLGMDGRFTISNMGVEMGAKCALFCADEKTLNWLKGRTIKKFKSVFADKNADYKEIKEFDISKLSPQVASPHSVDNVNNIDEVLGTKIDVAFLGTCTNGRLDDLKAAAKILRGRHVKKGVRLVVAPASKEIYLEAARLKILEVFLGAGGVILPPGCGPCVGTHAGVPADNEVVISSANRNFKGRMGNPRASIFLASPLTLAASAIEGKIADARKYSK